MAFQLVAVEPQTSAEVKGRRLNSADTVAELSDKGPIEKVIMKGDRRLACQVRVYRDMVIRLLHPAELAQF